MRTPPARSGFLAAVVAVAHLVSSAVAQDKPADKPAPVKDEPAARAVWEKLLDTMKKADSLSYTSAYKWQAGDRVIGEAEYRVRLKKPGFARVEGLRGKEKETAGVLVGDGERFWLYWPDGRPFFSVEDQAEHEKTRTNSYMRFDLTADQFSISHRVPMLGAGGNMLALQPAYFFGYLESLHPLIDGVRGRGTETVGGEVCDVIEVGYVKGQRSRTIWVSQKDHLPRRLTEEVRVKQTIIMEERWSDVSVNGKLDDAQFKWTPPKGWTEWKMPGVEAGVLPVGAAAPDFELTGADGKPVKLSDFRGKVVWLTFWRVGCPPCRVELKDLQGLHEKYGGKGVAFVGYNCADERAITLDLLKEYKITFPCVVDPSDKATDVFVKGYQRNGTNAVPLNYLIDKDGKVAAGWYGYNKDDDRPRKELEKLGVK
ncbi:MAG: redoxin domain-containing protein [Gemmataceae bacterium]